MLEGGAQSPTRVGACTRSLRALMVRQRIPWAGADLRALPDARLVQLALLAAVAGTNGPWQRDTSGGSDLLLLDENGRLRPAFVPSAVESDVMLCIICALLAVIAAYYYAGAAPPSATVTMGPALGGVAQDTPPPAPCPPAAAQYLPAHCYPFPPPAARAPLLRLP